MDSINDFVARKHGRSKVTYYDDRLRHILEETYGAIVYQEQVMRISMEMAGFPASKAEKLRKAMGKKIQQIMDQLYPEFIEGSVERGTARRSRSRSGTTSRSSRSTPSTRVTQRRTACSRTRRPT